MNLGLAPRARKCVVCREVTAVEDVTFRLFDEGGNRLLHGTKEGAAYVRSVGLGGTPQRVYNALVAHRKHVESWIRRQQTRAVDGEEVPTHVVPMQLESGVSRIPAPTGPVRWLDVTQTAMELGSEALREAAARLMAGDMEDKDVIGLAKLGVSTATTRATIELRGRKATGLEELLKLAAGVPRE